MNILIINCGSSSVKFQLINSKFNKILIYGLYECISGKNGCLNYKTINSNKKILIKKKIDTHISAIKFILKILVNKKDNILKNLNEIDAIGHRVLHGGMKILNSCIVNNKIISVINECCELGPLHNPVNLIGIKACMKFIPNKPNIAVFDTSFHQTIPKKAYLYAIPYKYYKKYKIKKYGFHGISHNFVFKKSIKLLKFKKNNSKIIIAHLGNGSSISCIMNGKCIDTSMGFTPLEGLIMGTRSGDLDPAVLEFICKKENISIEKMLYILNNKSGLLGLSNNISSDLRDLNLAKKNGNLNAIRAINCFCYRIIKYIGSYIAVMNGVDAIIFTGGIGENDESIRNKIIKNFLYLGIVIKNNTYNKYYNDYILTSKKSKIKIAVIHTNEELAIYKETIKLINNKK